MTKNFSTPSSDKEKNKDSEQEVRKKIIGEIEALYDEFLRKHQTHPHLKEPKQPKATPAAPSERNSSETRDLPIIERKEIREVLPLELKPESVEKLELKDEKPEKEKIAEIETYPEEPVYSPPPVELSYEVGTILRLETGDVVIFKDSMPDSEYDVVYYLCPDGRLESRGISLYSYEHQKIGKLSPAYLAEIERKMRWQREVILFHLDKLEFGEYIPFSDQKEPHPEFADQSDSAATSQPAGPHIALEKGTKIAIKQGRHKWEAIYWDADSLGPLVAYKAGPNWVLTHLDLSQYGDSLEYGERLSTEEIKEIEKALK